MTYYYGEDRVRRSSDDATRIDGSDYSYLSHTGRFQDEPKIVRVAFWL